jgi:hypothetical protein
MHSEDTTFFEKLHLIFSTTFISRHFGIPPFFWQADGVTGRKLLFSSWLFFFGYCTHHISKGGVKEEGFGGNTSSSTRAFVYLRTFIYKSLFLAIMYIRTLVHSLGLFVDRIASSFFDLLPSFFNFLQVLAKNAS